MTVETGKTRSGPPTPWTPRITAQLAILAAAAFIYATAEILPVGALPAISQGLDVSEALVGTLLAWYAVVAAATTIPLVRWTAHWPRRRVLLITLICLTASQVISALAPTFAVLAAGRALCAVTHGLMWSVLAPIATRLVPPSHSGRATTAIYVGTSLALVVGIPLTSAMSLLWGWRPAVVVITVAAASITVAARFALPALVLSNDQLALVGRHHYRNRRLLGVSTVMLIAVTGHFISYTFIAVIIEEVVGVPGARLAWLLAAFGAAGLVAMPMLARPLDHRPKAVTGSCMAALSTAFVVLAALSINGHHSTGTTVVAAAAIVLWGAMAMAVSPMLQSAAMRTAPDDPDGASGLYVTAFQVGITGGSLAGGLLFDKAGTSAMLSASALLVGLAAAGIAVSKRLFVVP
ncbi:MFS transporter [[Mycobacterium] nativiensis]|uniref:MFS transporter n=1 Tax=[Mycobacterium] nativiensis TaxID=2855503 RepID=A0ABU5XYS0_9MYCO|nr:MFS transporter [Mycolicibacter sp. MYC340]MEB3032978.1 MFS transporter [Mycolicibacter sp. MYC340]